MYVYIYIYIYILKLIDIHYAYNSARRIEVELTCPSDWTMKMDVEVAKHASISRCSALPS